MRRRCRTANETDKIQFGAEIMSNELKIPLPQSRPNVVAGRLDHHASCPNPSPMPKPKPNPNLMPHALSLSLSLSLTLTLTLTLTSRLTPL